MARDTQPGASMRLGASKMRSSIDTMVTKAPRELTRDTRVIGLRGAREERRTAAVGRLRHGARSRVP